MGLLKRGSRNDYIHLLLWQTSIDWKRQEAVEGPHLSHKVALENSTHFGPEEDIFKI